MERQIADDCAVQLLQEEVDDLLGKVADDLGFDNIADLRKFISQQVDESRSVQIKRAEKYLSRKSGVDVESVNEPEQSADQIKVNGTSNGTVNHGSGDLTKFQLVNYSSDSDDNSCKSPVKGKQIAPTSSRKSHGISGVGKRGLGSVTIVDYSSDSESENEIPPSQMKRTSMIGKYRRSSVGVGLKKGSDVNKEIQQSDTSLQEPTPSLSPISYFLDDAMPKDESFLKKDSNNRRKSRRSVCLPRAVILSSDSDSDIDNGAEIAPDGKLTATLSPRNCRTSNSIEVKGDAAEFAPDSSDSEIEMPVRKAPTVKALRRAVQSSDESEDDNIDKDIDNDNIGDVPEVSSIKKSGTSLISSPNDKDKGVIPETDSEEDGTDQDSDEAFDKGEEEESSGSATESSDESKSEDSNHEEEDNFNDFMKTWRKSTQEVTDSDDSDSKSDRMDDFIVNDLDDSDDDADDSESEFRSKKEAAIFSHQNQLKSGRFNYPSIPGTPAKSTTPRFDNVKKTLNEKALGTPRSAVKDVLDKVQPSGKASFGTPAYKRLFLKQRDTVTRELFELYNKTVFNDKLPSDMRITYNKRMTKTAGFCYYTTCGPDKVKGSRIELSEKVVDCPERVRDTLIHELCHAASWVVNGTRDGHGPIWKRWANKANQIHPELPVVTRCHAYDIETKYKYKCNGCGHIYGRHSKSIDSSRHRCSQCGGTPELMNATPSHTPSRYNMFVKENFSAVKKANPGAPHRDIMKIISQKFHDFKISSSNNKENVTPSVTPL